jgi:hypothetical protein
MALTSPGVEVTVIDESFYTSAEPGSVPLIVVATAENKLNGGGTAVAAGTLASNATNVYRISSQRELTETFGVPFFEKTATNNPVHGGERNEYGLLAAYSLLGATNSAFIMRANVDLNELAPTVVEPGAEPRDGTWWINTSSSTWGIQEWNNAAANVDGGQKFSTKTPTVLTDDDTTRVENGAPRASFGSIGDYAIVYKTVVHGGVGFIANDELARLYFKSAGNGDSVAGIVEAGEWVIVGSEEWTASWPIVTSTGSIDIDSSVVGWANTLTINGVALDGQYEIQDGDTAVEIAENIRLKQIPGIIASAIRGRLYIFSDGRTDPLGDSTNSGKVIIAGNSVLIGQMRITAGTFFTPRIVHAPHTRRPQFKKTETEGQVGFPSGSLWIKTTEPNGGARLRVSRWSTGAKTWVPQESLLFANATEALFNLDRSGGGRNILPDTLFTQYNAREYSIDNVSPYETAEFRIWRRRSTGATVITSAVITDSNLSGDSVIHISQSVPGSATISNETPIVFRANSTVDALDNANALAALINASTFTTGSGPAEVAVANNVVASVTSLGQLVITHRAGGEIRFRVIEGGAMGIFAPFNISTGGGTQNFYAVSDGIVTGSVDDFVASNWVPLAASQSPSYYPSPTAPLEEPEDGQLWFNPTYDQVDIMVHDGDKWRGYKNYYTDADPANLTDSAGPIVSATRPELQRDDTPLVEGDLWISTADLENYPTIYRFDNASGQWILLDKTDQTTEDGILFADARVNTDGESNTPTSIVDLLTSDFLDPDAPDPALYPRGMLLWNTRRSYGNVKRYVRDYVDTTQNNPRFLANQAGVNVVGTDGGESMSNYFADRWVTASPNNEDGSGSFGRKAQRAVVVAAMKSAIDTSEEARDEERRNFNLIACPGYPETLSNLVNLNIDRKLTAFVIGDTPLRLRADTTSLLSYATNARLVTDNGDAGIVTYDEYAAVYYPNGFTTDLSGSNAVVPASHMMLRTMILSDKASYPWFAPAGTRRGGITNATSVGFIDASTGEFRTVALNNGQRDTLYEQKINPIPFFVGVGHVAYGQKTRSRNASATDRINVSRLVVYLRSQLNKLARPYLFEPNDKKTRDEVKGAVESLLIELVGLRGIYDFAVVCDESNNTPDRVDRNELWVDVAIEPTKAVEFIYIPLRLKNTGEI